MAATSLVSTRGVGQYRAALPHRAGHTRLYKRGARKGVVLCCGWTGGCDHFYSPATIDQLPTITPILNAKFPTAAADEGGQWGSAEGRARVTDLRAYGQSNLGFAPGKIHLFGISAGTLRSMRWAMANPTLVQSLTLMLPAVSPQDLWDRDPVSVGIRASLTAAYGGRPADSEEPSKNTGLITWPPTKMYYNELDELCPANLAVAFGTAIGATLVNLGTTTVGGPIGHHNIVGIDRQGLADWIASND